MSQEVLTYGLKKGIKNFRFKMIAILFVMAISIVEFQVQARKNKVEEL